MTGILIKAIAGFYYVKAGNTVYECKARGILKKQGISPLPGDYVEFSAVGTQNGIIEAVQERKNSFKRPTVANVDKMFIVSSFSTPAPNTYLIDLMTVIAINKGIEPVVVFNKCDMGDFGEYEAIYKNAGFKVYTVSATTKQGLDSLYDELDGSVCVFTGNSGVGKSSLLNALFDGWSLATGDVSQKLGRGRHTTREVQLFEYGKSGYVVDTPGFSAIELKMGEGLDTDNLQSCFYEFAEYNSGCRFIGCSHTVEKGCSIIDAVNNGLIAKSRFESYCMIYNELKALEDNKYKN